MSIEVRTEVERRQRAVQAVEPARAVTSFALASFGLSEVADSLLDIHRLAWLNTPAGIRAHRSVLSQLTLED